MFFTFAWGMTPVLCTTLIAALARKEQQSGIDTCCPIESCRSRNDDSLTTHEESKISHSLVKVDALWM